jgi:hypothetical protein
MAQESIARFDLRRQRLVGGRQAFDGIADSHVAQSHRIMGVDRSGGTRHSERIQGLIQKYAGMIAGERAAGAVRSMHTGRKADDDQARIGVAEGRYRFAHIVGMQLPHRIKKSGETWATSAVRIEGAGDCGHIHLKKRAKRISE